MNKIKYQYGYFEPDFYDIFNFNIDDIVIDKLGIDSIHGNTCVSNINRISNYFNKIMNYNC
jgi:hypothetical protein